MFRQENLPGNTYICRQDHCISFKYMIFDWVMKLLKWDGFFGTPYTISIKSVMSSVTMLHFLWLRTNFVRERPKIEFVILDGIGPLRFYLPPPLFLNGPLPNPAFRDPGQGLWTWGLVPHLSKNHLVRIVKTYLWQCNIHRFTLFAFFQSNLRLYWVVTMTPRVLK